MFSECFLFIYFILFYFILFYFFIFVYSKLILAKINWCFVLKPEDYTKNMTNLIKCIKADMANLSTDDSSPSHAPITTHGMTLNFTHGLDLGSEDGYEGSVQPKSLASAVPFEEYTVFWDRHFAKRYSWIYIDILPPQFKWSTYVMLLI